MSNSVFVFVFLSSVWLTGLGVCTNRSRPEFGPEPDRNGPNRTGPGDSGPVSGP